MATNRYLGNSSDAKARNAAVQQWLAVGELQITAD
jgi:hypothetical protein